MQIIPDKSKYMEGSALYLDGQPMITQFGEISQVSTHSST